MKITQIEKDYSVTGQISVEDVDIIKSLGFKSILCHRPDGEEAGQPAFANVAARARQLQLKAAYVPVGPMGVGEDELRGMMDALDNLDRPILGYCRSGARSTTAYRKALQLRE